MPKRTDIKKVLIIGSGPIVIGQACEFDYSGTQACKALRQEGYEVILINSNPATIMTDPDVADQTYIEPITAEYVEKIIIKEKPDAVLPTLGGQTALNVSMQLAEDGIFDKYSVKMIGANSDAIKKAEDRELFKKAMLKIGLDLPRSAFAYSVPEALKVAGDIGYPLIVRPSYTLGGRGGGIVQNEEELKRIAKLGIESSRINEVLLEESIVGWKEYELEVMRDRKDNVVIICSIENLDPMGVHTGDSVTVAPQQTLTDKEYQKMRDAACAIIREIGVETGGSNVQFALNPANGRMVVIEMNPRVSRSSALASKATGFPIAKIAAKLAIGYTLDEINNDITQKTPASFEPTIDYCVIKIPRFTFEKFPEAKDVLGISMKSVGETMAIGRTFKEALQKGLRGLEIGHIGLDNKQHYADISEKKIIQKLTEPNASRLFYVKYALQRGYDIKKVCDLTGIDPWFVAQIKSVVDFEDKVIKMWKQNGVLPKELLLEAKQYGISDAQLGLITGKEEQDIRALRLNEGVRATFKLVDTCAAEFEAFTPYYYSTYESEDESRPEAKKKIMILGGGPNRIGQGIEFDYCCCHASFALKELDYETIMVNSNPETVSTDYDTSDKLYFEPLTHEDVMNIIDVEKPDGVIVQFGGQTPLNLAKNLEASGARIIGTSVDSIDMVEDRDKFSTLINKLNLLQPDNGSARSTDEAINIAEKIGYPVLVRPSYVLGGRAMRIIFDKESLSEFMSEAQDVSQEKPILIDRFLQDATEVDVDALSDGDETVIGGIMEHIENAGVHSGDSACVLPPHTLPENIINEIKEATYKLAREIKVIGLLNIQFAVQDGKVYVLEVNPRASRTIPFVSKAIGVPLAKIAAKVMSGEKIKNMGIKEVLKPNHTSVKESVLPFSRFSGVDVLLGPEMKSTGEVMGIGSSFETAFFKSQQAAGQSLPKAGEVFISVKDKDKEAIVDVAKKLTSLGFVILSTSGTCHYLSQFDVVSRQVEKISNGGEEVINKLKTNDIKLVINTPSDQISEKDMKAIRSLAVLQNIPCITTVQGAIAAVSGMLVHDKGSFEVQSIQEYAMR